MNVARRKRNLVIPIYGACMCTVEMHKGESDTYTRGHGYENLIIPTNNIKQEAQRAIYATYEYYK